VETEVSNTPEAVSATDEPTSAESASTTAPQSDPPSDSADSGADSASPETSTPVRSQAAESSGEASSDAGIVEETAISWNGEIDSLNDAEWFNSIEETHRNVLLDGMKTKYKHLESGFTKKTQEMAEFRKAAEEKEQQLASELSRYKRWLDTGEDLGTQALREADELRQKLEGATAEREAAEKILREQLAQEFQQQMSPVEQERDQLRQQLEESQRVAAAQEQARNEEVLDGLIKWVSETAPDLWQDDNEEALSTFTTLLETGAAQDPQTALKMVGALFPQFNPTAPEEVPASIDVMNNESTATFEVPGTEKKRAGYNDLKRQMEEQLFAARRRG
jgi:hypothetical protein